MRGQKAVHPLERLFRKGAELVFTAQDNALGLGGRDMCQRGIPLSLAIRAPLLFALAFGRRVFRAAGQVDKDILMVVVFGGIRKIDAVGFQIRRGGAQAFLDRGRSGFAVPDMDQKLWLHSETILTKRRP